MTETQTAQVAHVVDLYITSKNARLRKDYEVPLAPMTQEATENLRLELSTSMKAMTMLKRDELLNATFTIESLTVSQNGKNIDVSCFEHYEASYKSTDSFAQQGNGTRSHTFTLITGDDGELVIAAHTANETNSAAVDAVNARLRAVGNSMLAPTPTREEEKPAKKAKSPLSESEKRRVQKLAMMAAGLFLLASVFAYFGAPTTTQSWICIQTGVTHTTVSRLGITIHSEVTPSAATEWATEHLAVPAEDELWLPTSSETIGWFGLKKTGTLGHPWADAIIANLTILKSLDETNQRAYDAAAKDYLTLLEIVAADAQPASMGREVATVSDNARSSYTRFSDFAFIHR